MERSTETLQNQTTRLIIKKEVTTMEVSGLTVALCQTSDREHVWVKKDLRQQIKSGKYVVDFFMDNGKTPVYKKVPGQECTQISLF